MRFCKTYVSEFWHKKFYYYYIEVKIVVLLKQNLKNYKKIK